MTTIKYWPVSVIGDCEGRSMREVAKFSNEQAAKDFAISDAGRDMYRSPGKVGEPCTIAIYDTAEEAGAESREQIKKEALAKLTAAERAALGLKASG